MAKNRSEHFKRGMTGRVLERLRQDSARLAELEAINRLTPFVEAFKSALGTLAAYKPMSEWNDDFKAAFKHAARDHPAAAEEYRERNQKAFPRKENRG